MFENFDPNLETFDPYTPGAPGYTRQDGQVDVTTGQVGSFTVTVANATANRLNIELFNFLNSFTKIANPNLISIPPMTFADIAKANTNNRIYFDSTGNLIVEDSAGAKVTISCKEVAYHALFESSGVTPFNIQKIRLNVTNQAQISNDMVFTKKTFLGKVDVNTVSPRTWFNPNQFQGNIVDIPLQTEINAESGLQYAVNAGETVDLTFYLTAWRKFTLKTA